MKIETIERTSEKLLLKLTPVRTTTTLICIALMMLAAGLTSWLLGDVVQCELDNETLKVRSAFFDRFNQKETTVPVSKITGFGTEVRETALSKSMYVIAQLSNGQTVDIPCDAGMNGDDKRALAQQLGEKLNSAESYQYDSGNGMAWFGLIAGAMLFSAALYVLFSLQTCWVEADAGTHQLCVHSKIWCMPWKQRDAKCISMKDMARPSPGTKEDISLDGFETEAFTVNSDQSVESFYVFAVSKNERVPLATKALFTETSRDEAIRTINHWRHEHLKT